MRASFRYAFSLLMLAAPLLQVSRKTAIRECAFASAIERSLQRSDVCSISSFRVAEVAR